MTLHLGEKKFLGRTLLVSAAFLGMLAFAGAPRAAAESYDACQHRIFKADHRLHEAVEHHGWQSRQADNARRELREARERCWRENHRWWDEDGHRWHSDHDWDDHKGFSEHRVTAPEIDPSSTISALTLLAGGLVVLRGRKSGK